MGMAISPTVTPQSTSASPSAPTASPSAPTAGDPVAIQAQLPAQISSTTSVQGLTAAWAEDRAFIQQNIAMAQSANETGSAADFQTLLAQAGNLAQTQYDTLNGPPNSTIDGLVSHGYNQANDLSQEITKGDPTATSKLNETFLQTLASPGYLQQGLNNYAAQVAQLAAANFGTAVDPSQPGVKSFDQTGCNYVAGLIEQVCNANGLTYDPSQIQQQCNKYLNPAAGPFPVPGTVTISASGASVSNP